MLKTKFSAKKKRGGTIKKYNIFSKKRGVMAPKSPHPPTRTPLTADYDVHIWVCYNACLDQNYENKSLCEQCSAITGRLIKNVKSSLQV